MAKSVGALLAPSSGTTASRGGNGVMKRGM